jgi:hypothetical protein
VFYFVAIFYIEKFTNEEREGDMMFCVAAQFVRLGFGFGPQPHFDRTALG